MKKNLKRLFATLVVFGGLMTTDLFAPPTVGGGASGGSAGCWPPPCVPIDGGVGLLIAAGLAFGGKQLLSMRAA